MAHDLIRKAQRDAERYLRDPDRYRAQSRQYKIDNREKVVDLDRERHARSYAADPEKFKAVKRAEYQKNPEKFREQKRMWRLNNPEKAKAKDEKDTLRYLQNPEPERRRQRQRLYGLTPDQFDKLKEAQSNECAICKDPLTARAHIDHCHQTGAVRGLLCGKCNAGIGMLRDDPKLVRSALNYLERTPCQSE